MSTSWVLGAAGSGYDLDNLPFGVVASRGGAGRQAVRIGDHALDLRLLAEARLIDLDEADLAGDDLNGLLALGRPVWSALRARLRELLGDGTLADRVRPALTPLAVLEERLPVRIGDFVDFYASLEHATNLGRLFRPDGDPLLPNWRHLPVGYHGRAGTVVVSGTPVRRPLGQRSPEVPGGSPGFGPERRLDIEVELGVVLGEGPRPGRPIPPDEAAEHVFGIVLVNDWSARDIQRWEYQPLGPFLGKSFATTVSSWIVPFEALESRRVAGPSQEPEPLPYLRASARWALDVELTAELVPAGGAQGAVLVRTNARHLYWSAAQQLAHLTINGATFAAGDLLASGTISGPDPGSWGSLIERTAGGREPLAVDGVRRTFLEDGDEVVLRGRAGTVSLGECRGRIEAADRASV